MNSLTDRLHLASILLFWQQGVATSPRQVPGAQPLLQWCLPLFILSLLIQMELQSIINNCLCDTFCPFTRRQSRLTDTQLNTGNETNYKNLLEQNSETLCIQHNKNITFTNLQISVWLTYFIETVTL